MVDPRTTRSREQLVAAAVVGGIVLASLAVWLVVLVTTRGPYEERRIEWSTDEPAADRPSGAEEPTVDDDANEAQPDDPPPDEPPPDDADEQRDEETTTVDFDGVCIVEVEPAELDEHEDPRPWQFPACERAPIELSDGETSWIVVVESLPGDDFDEREALARAEDHDQADQLLWSSHYASLNPDLWVVFDGPFRDQEAATDAADRIGGGSYPRLLSDDDDDR